MLHVRRVMQDERPDLGSHGDGDQEIGAAEELEAKGRDFSHRGFLAEVLLTSRLDLLDNRLLRAAASCPRVEMSVLRSSAR